MFRVDFYDLRAGWVCVGRRACAFDAVRLARRLVRVRRLPAHRIEVHAPDGRRLDWWAP